MLPTSSPQLPPRSLSSPSPPPYYAHHRPTSHQISSPYLRSDPSLPPASTDAVSVCVRCGTPGLVGWLKSPHHGLPAFLFGLHKSSSRCRGIGKCICGGLPPPVFSVWIIGGFIDTVIRVKRRTNAPEAQGNRLFSFYSSFSLCKFLKKEAMRAYSISRFRWLRFVTHFLAT